MNMPISLDELCAIVGQPHDRVRKNMLDPQVYMLSDVTRLRPEISYEMAEKRLRFLRTAMKARSLR